MIIDTDACSDQARRRQNAPDLGGENGTDATGTGPGAGPGAGAATGHAAGSKTAADKLEIENHERARQREIAAYLEAASFPDGLPWGPPDKPFLNTDATLNALVQLGALRLDTDRSFLSFIDRETQWVVSEMTRSHSIREWKCNGDDRVWLGVARLEACWGVCPTTMKAFLDETGAWVRTGPNVIANRTRYIVNDFRTDPAYKDRPYVKDYPYFTSYLEVPLISPLGYLLGSYCVVDSKLHDFDKDETISIMNDIAAAIMDHLDNVRMKQNLHRSEQLLQGLSAFIGSDPSPPPPSQTDSLSFIGEHSTESVLTSRSSAPSSAVSSSHKAAKQPRPRPPPNQASSSFESTGSGRSLLRNNSSATNTPMTSVGDEASGNPLDQQSSTTSQTGPSSASDDPPASYAALQRQHGLSNSTAPESHANGFISSANIKSAFFRAATTIRQTMSMDGLMFLDAVPSTYLTETDRLALGNADNDLPDESCGPFCAAIVQSNSSDAAQSPQTPHTRLPEAILQRFIRRFPRGHVFSADEFGPIDEVYAPGKRWPGLSQFDRDNILLRKDVAVLFQVLPMAKYIVFLPLWHFQRECWYAAALGWVADLRRPFDEADVGLVAAFGNSVMAEVSRMETLAASRAKTSFVSSISHELRSPLHGILASSELLREGISDPSLLSTLDMLDSCGKTLLDTFTNLLDHAIVIKDGKSAATSVTTMRVADLGRLVEDVIDAVHFSHLSEHATQSSLRSNGVYSIHFAKATKSPASLARPLLVTLNISAMPSWDMPIDVGAWKRIVMNIYSNALKYTKTGRIEVSLKLVQKPDKTGQICNHVSFSVEDTGKGMSSDYLKYSVFTPFSQEDAHAPGIGLGLSIVQQIASGLGGAIDIKSSVGVGTLVEVALPVKRVGGPVSDGPLTLSSHLDQYHLGGKTLCLIPPEAYAAVVKAPLRMTNAIRNRAATVERLAQSNAGGSLGMKVLVGGAECPLPPADLYLIDSDIFGDVASSNGPQALLSTVSPLVLLCSGAGPPSCLKHEVLKSHGLHLHHPIGPKKMLTFFTSTLNLLPTETVSEEPPATPDQQDLPTGAAPDAHPQETDALTPLKPIPIRPKIRHTYSVQDIRPQVPEHSQSPQLSSPQQPTPDPLQSLPSPGLELATSTASPTTIKATVSLPLEPGLRKSEHNKPKRESDTGANTKPTTPGPLHLLLVDDNPINIKLLSAVVKKLNHTFETAANGLEAVELYQASLGPGPDAKRFDTVFMDISMPVMDGFEAIREIRKLEAARGILPGGGGHQTPCKIVALTGLSSELSRKEAFANGSDLFLTKPVKLAMVRSVLR